MSEGIAPAPSLPHSDPNLTDANEAMADAAATAANLAKHLYDACCLINTTAQNRGGTICVPTKAWNEFCDKLDSARDLIPVEWQ